MNSSLVAENLVVIIELLYFQALPRPPSLSDDTLVRSWPQMTATTNGKPGT